MTVWSRKVPAEKESGYCGGAAVDVIRTRPLNEVAIRLEYALCDRTRE